MLERLSILTLIPDADCRVRLREVLNSIIFKSEIRAVRTIPEAAAALQSDPSISLLFIASSVGGDAVRKLVEEVSGSGKELSTAILVTVDRHTSSKLAAVVQLYMQGVDGFISEPYSSDQLRSLIETVLDPAREKVMQGATRAYKSSTLLLGDAVRHLDDLWRAKAMERKDVGAAPRELRAIAGQLAEIHKKFPDQYASALCAVFEAVPAPRGEAALLKKKNFSDVAPHPGAVVSALMHERGLTREKILGIIRIDPTEFDELVTQKRAFTEVAAREISRALGKTAREWLALQKRYDSLHLDSTDAAVPPNNEGGKESA
jgi:plasmid maintenance system antidote protein VapI/DNA-binding NarL/FixJ family response regulator